MSIKLIGDIEMYKFSLNKVDLCFHQNESAFENLGKCECCNGGNWWLLCYGKIKMFQFDLNIGKMRHLENSRIY